MRVVDSLRSFDWMLLLASDGWSRMRVRACIEELA